MSGITEIVAFFCAASVMCGAFNILAGKTLEKSFKFVLALIFLSIMVSSFAKVDFKLNIPKSVSAIAESENVLALSSYQAEYIIRSLLDEKNIKYTKISVLANKEEDGGIVINEILVSGAEETETIRELILNLNITETVKFE